MMWNFGSYSYDAWVMINNRLFDAFGPFRANNSSRCLVNIPFETLWILFGYRYCLQRMIGDVKRGGLDACVILEQLFPKSVPEHESLLAYYAARMQAQMLLGALLFFDRCTIHVYFQSIVRMLVVQPHLTLHKNCSRIIGAWPSTIDSAAPEIQSRATGRGGVKTSGKKFRQLSDI